MSPIRAINGEIPADNIVLPCINWLAISSFGFVSSFHAQGSRTARALPFLFNSVVAFLAGFGRTRNFAVATALALIAALAWHPLGHKAVWNPATHTDQENLQWSWLRAVEWGGWPAFLSQLVVPAALLVFNWVEVIGFVALARCLWGAGFGYRFVDAGLAGLAALAVKLKWPIMVASAIVLFRRASYVPAMLVVFYPAIAPVLAFLPVPSSTRRLQVLFMRELGYEPSESKGEAV